MQPIPPPEILSSTRVARDDSEGLPAEDYRSQARLLGTALDQSCEYAQQMWDDLNRMRGYLHDSLPEGTTDDDRPVGATPSGPDDDEGWERWIDAYAEVTSVLCGSHGDSGYGRGEAVRLAQLHRSITSHRTQPDSQPPGDRQVPTEAQAPTTDASRGRHSAEPTEPTEPTGSAGASEPASGVDSAAAALVTPLVTGAIGAALTVFVVNATRRFRGPSRRS